MSSDHPADALAERRALYAKRKDFSAQFGAFVRTMREAMTAYLHARQTGLEREDAIKGLESVIRDTWPKPVTKFGPKCDTCDDIGYEELICRQWARCQRERCNGKGEDWQHRYLVPCTCPKGDRFQPRHRTPDDALATVGKVSKPKRGFSRMGIS